MTHFRGFMDRYSVWSIIPEPDRQLFLGWQWHFNTVRVMTTGNLVQWITWAGGQRSALLTTFPWYSGKNAKRLPERSSGKERLK